MDKEYLIIGLGNPRKQYAHNRHNVGHMFIDEGRRSKVEVRDKLLKTDVFMNESGKFVKKKIAECKLQITDLIIVHDDLDIPLGKFKIQFGVGPKVHNGLTSVEEQLGTKDFWRIRIGVDNRDPEDRTPGEQYVLEDFTKEELKTLVSLFSKIWEELRLN